MGAPGSRAAARALVVAPLGLGLALVVVPPAMAVGPSLVNADGTATVTATEAMTLYVEPAAGGTGFTLTGDTFDNVSGCTQGGDASSYTCPGVTLVVVNGSAVDDRVSASEYLPVPLEVHAGAGADTIGGGHEGDTLDGGGGVDLLVGNQGDDTLSGGPGDDDVWGNDGHDRTYFYDDGDDVLDGDDGADTLHPGGGTDVVNGGAGTDTVAYDGELYENSLSVTLDGLGNDGPDGDNDNVGPVGDVENVTGPQAMFGIAVTLIGDDGANVLIGDEMSDDGVLTIDGGAGDDTVSYAPFYPAYGDVTLRGGAGDDTITGWVANEDLEGGAGADTIVAGGGWDTIDLGPGQDTVNAGGGNDTIEAGDGEVDQVHCGNDADAAHVDPVDVVDGATCEDVSVVGEPDVTVPETYRYRLNRRGVATFSLTNNSDFGVGVFAEARRLTGRLAGQGEASLDASGTGQLRLKLNRRARAVVRRTGSLKAVVTFLFVGNGLSAEEERPVKFLRH